MLNNNTFVTNEFVYLVGYSVSLDLNDICLFSQSLNLQFLLMLLLTELSNFLIL